MGIFILRAMDIYVVLASVRLHSEAILTANDPYHM
jgi:hypothetical protein